MARNPLAIPKRTLNSLRARLSARIPDVAWEASSLIRFQGAGPWASSHHEGGPPGYRVGWYMEGNDAADRRWRAYGTGPLEGYIESVGFELVCLRGTTVYLRPLTDPPRTMSFP